MERTIVIYKSKYGATDRYAAWIGEELDCPVVELENFDKKSIDNYDNIIYGGGVHAGGIRGWEDFKKIIKPYLDSAYYEGLEKISEQLAIKNRRSKMIWKIIGIILLLIVVFNVLMVVLFSVNTSTGRSESGNRSVIEIDESETDIDD